MPRPDDRLRLRSGEIAAKVVDGEVILINLANGVYYSMEGVGASIWELLVAGHSPRAIAAHISDRYDAAPEQVAADVDRLIAELLGEELVEPSAEVPPPPPLPVAVATAKQAYESPRLNAYRDMADLLANDPPLPGLADIPWDAAPDETRAS